MPSRKLALVMVIALSGSLGCSLLFVDRPPANHASMRYFDCTSSRLAPSADATLAGLLALGALGSTADNTNNGTSTVEVGVLAAGALASAVYGFNAVGRCRDAKEDLARRLFFEPEAPPPLMFAPAAGPAPFASRPAADPWLSAGPPPGVDFGPPPPAPPAPLPRPLAPVAPTGAGAPDGGTP